MTEPLNLQTVIGFGGEVSNGLILHPDGSTIIYPLGSTVVLRDKLDSRSQEFLQGHTDRVTCLAMSPSGRYLASGQATYMGYVADIIIWDLNERTLVHRMQLQKGKIQALAFSCDEGLLASLGGEDDNSLVLWDVASGRALCGAQTPGPFVLALRFLRRDGRRLVTGGNGNLTLWTYVEAANKLVPHEAKLGSMQRHFRSLYVDAKDEYVYGGTSSGDVLQVSLEHALLRNTGPAKALVQQGVTALLELPGGLLLLGGGDGSVSVLRTAAEPNPKNPKVLKHMAILTSARLEGAVASLALEASPASAPPRGGWVAYAGTAANNMYRLTFDAAANKLSEERVQTAHKDRITSIAFPEAYSEVFAATSAGCIRLWQLSNGRELLRVSVPNLECRCVKFMPDGKSIISGWSDGKIRAFTPETGKLLYTINNAHHKAVTALAATRDSARIVSGGEEGMVRVWRIGKQSQVMEASMKDHRGPVNAIALKSSTDDEAVSASSDGSCIIWDMAAHKRRASLFANTFFLSVAYHPDESQIVTTGTDRKITYWDACDGTAIRIIDGSPSSQLDTLAVDASGEALISGGADKLVKLWGYDIGVCCNVGVAHSSAVTCVAVTHDKRAIVSAGAEGALCVWDYAAPKQLD